jgi:hypothetical protein
MAFLTKAANRGSIATGYEIEGSICFEDANDENLVRNYSGDGDRRTWTYSTWIKKQAFGSSIGIGFDYMYLFGAAYTSILFLNDDRLRIELYNGSTTVYADTSMLFRDPAAWYHIVVQLDSTQSTASDRVKIWVNGVRITSFNNTTYTNMSQNEEFGIGLASNNYQLGYWFAGGSNNRGFSGYMAETHYANGTAYEASDFGEFDDNGIWIPKEFEGSHGTKGFYLKFTNPSNIGEDSSDGGIGDFSPNGNTTSADLATDSPTNNFAVPNMLVGTGGFFVMSEGGTKGVLSTAAPGNNIGGVSLVSTIPVSKGKWYFEAQNTNAGDVYLFLGVADTASIGYTDGYVLGGQSGTLPSIAWRGGGAYDGSAKVYTNNVATGSSVNWETEVVGVALDLDNDKIYFHKSGTYINSGDPVNGTDNGGQYDLPTPVDDQWLLGVSAYNLATWLINFGGYTTMSISSAETDANGYGTFEYAPPSGYYALCTKNLAEYG